MEPIPDHLVHGAHRFAALRSAEVSRRELRGDLWRRPHHGRYAWAAVASMSPEQRIAEAASVLPAGGALAGWAAAFLHGATDLDGRRWDGFLEPVLFALPYDRRVRREGIATIRAPLVDSDLAQVDGLIVTSSERSCFDVIRMGTLEEAVVGVDAMLRAKVVSAESIGEFVTSRAGWKGVPTARAALDLSDGRAASCPESRFRVIWVVEAGLVRPEVNQPVYSPAGVLIGVPDLLDLETGLVGEYDGSDHRALKRHTDDNAREERFESHGLTVVRATSIDLKYRRRLMIARLRDGLRRAGRRDARRDRWTVDPP
jgi:hypothetical protein